MLARLVVAAFLAGSHSAQSGGPGEGFTLFAPSQSTTTYLIDHSGTVLHQWASGFTPGLMAYLADDGHLLRMIKTNSLTGPGTTGPGGGIQELLWDGTVVWDWRHDTPDVLSHHDMALLPNGNVLVISMERRTQAEALAAGRDPAFTSSSEWWVDYVLEVQKSGPTTGSIVWEWHAWDHLVQDFDVAKPNFDVVANRSERIDLNFPALDIPNGDWTHANGVDYHAGFDQLVLSVRGLSELWVVDHGTTTSEAAGTTGGRQGRGGDLLYRWGNPEAYRAGTSADRAFYLQHDANWVAPGRPGAGNLVVFNNGWGRPAGAFSSVDELVPPVDASGAYAQPAPGTPFEPAAPVWSYTTPTPSDFYSNIISGAVRLANGNTLVCSGQQFWMFEIDPAGALVWQYFNPFGGTGLPSVFKVRRYAHYLFPSSDTLPAGTGANIDFELVAGSDHAGEGYVLLASLSGTTPGSPMPGSSAVVPLNYDSLTLLVFTNLNTPTFASFAGALDSRGLASARLAVGPLDAATVGLTAHFAYVTTPGLGFASNAMPVSIVP